MRNRAPYPKERKKMKPTRVDKLVAEGFGMLYDREVMETRKERFLLFFKKDVPFKVTKRFLALRQKVCL